MIVGKILWSLVIAAISFNLINSWSSLYTRFLEHHFGKETVESTLFSLVNTAFLVTVVIVITTYVKGTSLSSFGL
jgi:multisubunit Na+/H+ antiporter MnhB subunit